MLAERAQVRAQIPGSSMLFGGRHRQSAGVLGKVASSRPIAVDFGATCMKVLQLSAGDPPGLVAAACVPTPEQFRYNAGRRLNWQVEQLGPIIRKGGFRGRRVACVLPSSSTFCKHMQVSLGEGVDARAVVESAIPAELNCPAEALIMRHHEVGQVGKTGGRTELICMATPRVLVQKIMDALRRARLEAVGMYPEVLTLLRAFEGLRVAEADPTMYIDLGWSTTRIVIAHGSDLVFARSIDMGGRQFDEVVQQRLNCDPAGANRTRLELTDLAPTAPEPAATTGMPHLDAQVRSASATATAPEIDLSEPLEMLTDEISMCVRYHASVFPEHQIASAVFVGGEARQRALCEHIARTLRLPGHAADPMARVARTGRETVSGVDLKAQQPGWASVLGACLSPTDL